MKQKILAIDDEPDLLRLLERIIRDKTNYDITVTSNSLELPLILEKDVFDIIITDLKMPGLDGLDILKFVNDNKRSELVIMITAFGTLETAMEAIVHGIFDYITKPFRKEQILFTIDRAMKYQKTLKEYKRMKSIFEIEPFDSAVNAFKQEYMAIRNLEIKQ